MLLKTVRVRAGRALSTEANCAIVSAASADSRSTGAQWNRAKFDESLDGEPEVVLFYFGLFGYFLRVQMSLSFLPSLSLAATAWNGDDAVLAHTARSQEYDGTGSL